MKTNLIIFTLILLLPFALSSQTRKAIPAGRFEALSGVKISHVGKNQDTNKDSVRDVWSEIEKIYVGETTVILFANMGSIEIGFKSKNFHEAKSIEAGFDVLITSDIKKDKAMTKYLRGKKLIALFDARPLQKMLNSLNNYEVLSFHREKATNFYLLKTK